MMPASTEMTSDAKENFRNKVTKDFFLAAKYFFLEVKKNAFFYWKHESSAYGGAAPSAKSLCAHFDPVCISLFPHLTRW